jgi:zinc transport system substrate-binding protein
MTVFVTGLVVAFGCRRPSPATSTIRVEASIYPVFFFAQQIGSDQVAVRNVTPAGVQPHDYEPTAQDLAAIESARLFVLNGGGFEPWGDKIKQNLDPRRTVVVVAGEGLTTERLIENGENLIDPHVWLSPPLAKQMVHRIEQGFEQVDPNHARFYDSNRRTLDSQLDDLDGEYRRGLAHCATKDVTTSHAAFGYLATTYGLHQVPIFGLSPDAEPSPRQLANIASFAKQNRVTTIFFESLLSPKLSETIATEVGAKTMVLDPIEGLTSDDLAAGKTYFTAMRQNLANLRGALQCTP